MATRLQIRFHALIELCLADLRRAHIVLLGAMTCLGILPFAVFRALGGEWTAAAVDVVLLLAISGNSILATRGAGTAVAGPMMIACVSLGCIAATAATGVGGLLWTYVVLIGNFMLSKRSHALIGNAVAIAGVLLVSGLAATPVLLVCCLVTACLVTLYGFAFAWSTDRQRDTLERLALHDALTGVPNRRAMEMYLRDAIAAHRIDGQPTGLAIADIDHFKAINDLHGHEEGDRVLAAFARIVQHGIRGSDRLFRIGGEEFVLLFPATGRDGMEVALEKVQERLRDELRSPSGAVTCSFGATLLGAGEDWQSWLARADLLLYCAKRDGRDRVCLDAPPRTGPRAVLRLVS